VELHVALMAFSLKVAWRISPHALVAFVCHVISIRVAMEARFKLQPFPAFNAAPLIADKDCEPQGFNVLNPSRPRLSPS